MVRAYALIGKILVFYYILKQRIKFLSQNHFIKMTEKNYIKKVIIVCGPTASGKTSFAHELALKNNGEIINADSMQLYKQLPIITASPEQSLKDELQYHLYNFQEIDQEFSAIKYVHKASDLIKKIAKNGKLPIIVGGSGMYINMLVNGYSLIPEINPEIRFNARNLHKKIGSKLFFNELIKLDPKIAFSLNESDSQRIIRAYEVVKQTGKSILQFQSEGNKIILPEFDFKILYLLPERQFLYNTCNDRLKKLFDMGGIEEVESIYKKYGQLKSSAMKALGVDEIISYIKNDITYNRAVELASTRTRQYAKRQITWFSNRLDQKQMIQFSDYAEYDKIVKEFNLHNCCVLKA